jgi:hypothetical protein
MPTDPFPLIVWVYVGLFITGVALICLTAFRMTGEPQ